jgi:hypothetical protein
MQVWTMASARATTGAPKFGVAYTLEGGRVPVYGSILKSVPSDVIYSFSACRLDLSTATFSSDLWNDVIKAFTLTENRPDLGSGVETRYRE